MSQAPIGHVDADRFYVAAERLRYEAFRTVPLAVLGNQGACVIARSYEMSAAGVAVGEPIWEALPKCPDGVYLKRDFAWYETLSRLMLGVVRELSPRVEYYSIDEFFFEATPPRGMDHQGFAALVRDRILARVGIPATVGIARSRSLAKLISDTAKPFGASAVLDRASEESLLASRPVTDITGIAGRRERRLQPWGVRTCLDFAAADRGLIRRLLTATGEALWWELNGEPVLPLRPDRPPHKVLSRGGSLGEPTDRPMVLFAWLVRHLERLVEELRYHGVTTGRVAVWVAYRDGRVGDGRASLTTPTDRFDLLLDTLRSCLRRAWIPRATATRMHLFAERLTPKGATQLGLFDPPGDAAERVARLKAEVNRRIGRWALRSAATLPLAAVYGDRSNAVEVCDIHGKMCF